jgi:hypothetical protein
VSTPDATATATDGDNLNVDWNAGADDNPLERPEVQAGVAFAGGIVLAFVLKRLRGV